MGRRKATGASNGTCVPRVGHHDTGQYLSKFTIERNVLMVLTMKLRFSREPQTNLIYLIINLHMYFGVFILLCCLFKYIYPFMYLYSLIYLCLFNDHISNSECIRSNANVTVTDLR